MQDLRGQRRGCKLSGSAGLLHYTMHQEIEDVSNGLVALHGPW